MLGKKRIFYSLFGVLNTVAFIDMDFMLVIYQLIVVGKLKARQYRLKWDTGSKTILINIWRSAGWGFWRSLCKYFWKQKQALLKWNYSWCVQFVLFCCFQSSISTKFYLQWMRAIPPCYTQDHDSVVVNTRRYKGTENTCTSLNIELVPSKHFIAHRKFSNGHGKKNEVDATKTQPLSTGGYPYL